MTMWGDGAKAVGKALKEVYDQHIIIRTQFEHIKETATEALAEFRRLNENQTAKITSLEARIAALEAKLAAMTEQSMMRALEVRAEEFVRAHFAQATNITSQTLLTEIKDGADAPD